jgi:tetratricopeptide (TPR) repeat protein
MTATAPARPTAEQLWLAARQSSDRGQWTTSRRFAGRALRAWHGEPDADLRLKVRILISLAYNESELGRTAVARKLLAQAAEVSPELYPEVRVARGLLAVRTGRPDDGIAEFDAAIRQQRAARTAREREDLAGALINRGLLHMTAGRLAQAAADTAEAGRMGRELDCPDLVFMAEHNLGFVRYLGGDLPGALSAMESAAAASAQDGIDGVSYLDRARVLVAAGLPQEAREFVDAALAAFVRNGATADLVEAYGVRADLDLMTGDATEALSAARRAAALARRRGNDNAALIARVLQLRARRALRQEALRDEDHPRSGPAAPARTASRDARDAAALAADLDAAGLPDDARSARLLEADALLDAGRVPAAEEVAAQVRGGTRSTVLSGRLHLRLVDARLALARGDRRGGLTAIRRGLDDLAGFQARFGSQDLQSAGSLHGEELAALGLRTAVQDGSPAAIFQWLERARGVTTRLPQVRPTVDPELAAELGALRATAVQVRQAALAGRRNPALQARLRDLRRRVRARTWRAGADGRVQRPPGLADVRRKLAGFGTPAAPATALAYLHGNGGIHVLVIRPSGASFHTLCDAELMQQQVLRTGADLDLLASARVPGPVRTVARRSLDSGLQRLADLLLAPVAELVGGGPVLVSGIGALATVPWLQLPGLVGRPVTVSSSVTASLADAGRPAQALGVLSVAGPGVPLGVTEAESVAALHPGASVLTDGAATGRAVLAGLPDGGLLHVAAHGHHETDSPLFSSVLLADGPLYGYDIAPNPELPQQVVLSSCEVGRHDTRSGEPLGLAAALLRSGVRTVIAGVSRVADDVAADVMTDYHRRLIAGAAPAAALAAAVAGSPEPAPFSCFGVGVA